MREELGLKNWLNMQLALLFGKYFSLDRMFRKNKAQAVIFFVEGEDKIKGSIRIEINGVSYFFEGEPIIEEYKNHNGLNVMKKILNYGGWEIDMTNSNNKII